MSNNLVINSTFDYGLTGWIKYGVVANSSVEIVAGYNGHNGVKITRTGYTSSIRIGLQGITIASRIPILEKGKTYTLSAWVKVDVAPDGSRNHIFPRTVEGDVPAIAIPTTAPIGQWVKYEVSHTFNGNYQPTEFDVLLEKNGSMTVSCIMLEEGSTANVWSPSPEDITLS